MSNLYCILLNLFSVRQTRTNNACFACSCITTDFFLLQHGPFRSWQKKKTNLAITCSDWSARAKHFALCLRSQGEIRRQRAATPVRLALHVNAAIRLFTLETPRGKCCLSRMQLPRRRALILPFTLLSNRVPVTCCRNQPVWNQLATLFMRTERTSFNLERFPGAANFFRLMWFLIRFCCCFGCYDIRSTPAPAAIAACKIMYSFFFFAHSIRLFSDSLMELLFFSFCQHLRH